MRSVGNSSGLPGFSPGWNRPEGRCPGQEPPRNPIRGASAVLLLEADINPLFFGRVVPGPRFHTTVLASSRNFRSN